LLIDLCVPFLRSTRRDTDEYEQPGVGAEAEEIHRQALWLRKTVLGKEHPSTLTSVDNLALALRPQGKYEEAEEMHRQALGCRRRC
jgi:hypothetical protein